MRQVYRLVSDFLLPHLERKTFGKHLVWEDRNNGVFKISRIHQSSEMWNENCLEVYKAWSMEKKLWNHNDEKKITKAKHRLITALRRNPDIEILKKEDLYYRFRVVIQSNNKMKSRKKRHLEEKQAFQRQLPKEDKRSDFVPTDEPENHWSYNDLTIIKMPENLSETVVYQANEPFSESENFKHVSINVKDELQLGAILTIEKQETQTTDRIPLTNQARELTDKATLQVQMREHHQQVSLVGKDMEHIDKMQLDEEAIEYSHKCCCEILLDNYLCNKLCLWHGMPP